MVDLVMKMEKLPEKSLISEYPSTILHAGRYGVMVDGPDCYIYEEVGDQEGLKYLCNLSGAEITERLGIALLRAATIQNTNR